MILRSILGILCLPLIFLFGVSFWDLLKLLSFENPLHVSFIVSFIGSTLLFALFLSRGSFLAIFEHELTHNLWAILTFNKPTGFHIEKGYGGEFNYEGKGNFLMALSPYFSLTFSFLILPLYLVIQQEYYKYFIIILGILTGFHTSTTLKETGFRQTDLKEYGYLFSFIIIILGNILSYGIILAFVTGSWGGIREFIISGFKELYSFLISLPQFLN